MATKPNAICEICNKPYYKCSKCDSTPHYKAFTCSPECWQIRTILMEYDANPPVLNDKEAANQFAYLGITLDSDLEKCAGAVNTIREILEKGSTKEEKPIKHTKRNKFYKNED